MKVEPCMYCRERLVLRGALCRRCAQHQRERAGKGFDELLVPAPPKCAHASGCEEPAYLGGLCQEHAERMASLGRYYRGAS
jgi:hypothetical protein